jgi:hypothetical protein
VAGGIITAVEMLSFKLRRVENGTGTDVDLRDSGFWKKLRDAQFEIEEVKRRNKSLEEQLLRMENGKDVEKGDTVTVKTVDETCLVLGDSIVRNVRVEKSNMRFECFPGIRADQLRRVTENRDLGYSDDDVIHVGTNDVRRSSNLDYITGEVYDLVNMAKAKFPGSRQVLSGVLRSKGVKWRRVRVANYRPEWVARILGATFIDPNSWILDVDFGRDGLHLNRNGVRELGDLYSRVCGVDGGSRKVINNELHTAGSEFSEETSETEGPRKKADQENSMFGPEAVEAEENAQKEMMDNAGKKRKGGARDEIQTMAPAHNNEG